MLDNEDIQWLVLGILIVMTLVSTMLVVSYVRTKSAERRFMKRFERNDDVRREPRGHDPMGNHRGITRGKPNSRDPIEEEQ